MKQNKKQKSDKKDIKDKFEFDQAWFEEFCEKLHELLEMKTDDFFDEERRDVFLKYKEKVIDITQATKKVLKYV